MSGIVTAKDVASAAAVSVVTVSRVLNNHAHVTNAVRQRVLQAAAELGYTGRRRVILPTVSSRLLHEIGFLFDTFANEKSATSNPFWSQVLAGAESEARRLGLKLSYLTVASIDSDLMGLLAMLRDMQLHGLLLAGPASPALVRALTQSALPMVLLDNRMLQQPIDAILSDSFEGAYTAVSYLLEHGHRQIACVGGPTSDEARQGLYYPFGQRAIGYRTALFEHGIALASNLIVPCAPTAQNGYDACRQLLAQHQSFSAAFCVNDDIAIGVVRALREAGRQVPEDISIVGFDDFDIAAHLSPPLSTVHVPAFLMGVHAVQSLVARAADLSALPRTITLPGTFIARDSVVQRD